MPNIQQQTQVNGARVVTLGESLIRYSPKGYERLEQARELDVRVAGAESNFAIACARLGIKTAWISKLTRNPFGRFIHDHIALHGVDTSGVIWTNKHRVGKYYIEFGKSPRPTRVYYDRSDSACCSLQPDEVNWQMVRDASLFHITGITPALSNTCEAVTLKALQEAKRSQTLISFDVNYRAKLWSPEQAQKVLNGFLHYADLIIISKRDAKIIFKQQGSEEETLHWFDEIFNPEIVVLTLSIGGAILKHHDNIYHLPALSVDTIDPIGTGDAFDAGFVYGFLSSKNVETALSYATALAGLKRTIPGDEALVSLDEVIELLHQQNSHIQR